jgi:hypothetical protein
MGFMGDDNIKSVLEFHNHEFIDGYKNQVARLKDSDNPSIPVMMAAVGGVEVKPAGFWNSLFSTSTTLTDSVKCLPENDLHDAKNQKLLEVLSYGMNRGFNIENMINNTAQSIETPFIVKAYKAINPHDIIEQCSKNYSEAGVNIELPIQNLPQKKDRLNLVASIQ